jgi:DNA-binding PadR family transcriptional regulator
MLKFARNGRHGGHPHGRRGGGGRVRLINRGDLRLLILKLLEAGARHGYELIKAFEERSSGTYAPSPGMVYPALALLEDRGEIAGSEDSGRRHYALTETGHTALAGQEEVIAALFQRIEDFGRTRTATETGPVRRAMDNLRQVLAERATASELPREDQLSIAEIIDEAARRIERL